MMTKEFKFPCFSCGRGLKASPGQWGKCPCGAHVCSPFYRWQVWVMFLGQYLKGWPALWLVPVVLILGFRFTGASETQPTPEQPVVVYEGEVVDNSAIQLLEEIKLLLDAQSSGGVLDDAETSQVTQHRDGVDSGFVGE